MHRYQDLYKTGKEMRELDNFKICFEEESAAVCMLTLVRGQVCAALWAL